MIRPSWLAAVLALAAAYSTAHGQAAEPVEPSTAASNLTQLFAEGNTAAQRGTLPAAVARYTELLEANVHDPDVYFNLAVALARSGDYPGAILNLERALDLRPGDSKAAENLRSAERALEESRAEAEGEASIRRSRSITDAVYQWVTEDTLAYALLAANLLLFGVLGWAWIRRRRGRLFYSLLITSGAVLLFCAVGLTTKSGLLRDGPRAVVLGDRISLLEGPDPRAQVRGEARGGDRGVLVAQDGEFVKLRVVGGPEGWVEARMVGTVPPSRPAD